MCRGVPVVKDLYAVLQLKPDADLLEIRKAYRRAALRAHPDKGGAAEKFIDVQLAFRVLSCSTSRKVYDSTYGHGYAFLASWPQAQASHAANFAASTTTRPKRPGAFPKSADSRLKRYRHCEEMNRADVQDRSARIAKKRMAPRTLDEALERMRVVLQGMSTPQRLSALRIVEPCVAASLHEYMKKYRATRPQDLCPHQCVSQSNIFKRMNKCGFGRVRVGRDVGDARYRTQLVIRGLRIYSRARHHEDAVEQHMILVQMRDALALESRLDPGLWANPQKLFRVFKTVLEKNKTSERDLNLHTYIYMKAAPWLNSETVISSPVMQLSQAISVYTRLVLAQSVSWERFRAEWVRLLMRWRKGQAQARSKEDAEAVADQARETALERQFKQVRIGVNAAMQRQKAQAAALQRVARRRQRQVFQQRWLRRKDLTMEDLMSGRHE